MEIVSAITAYDHPNGATYILEVIQALYSPQQELSLLNPNQMWWNHLIVDDTKPSIWCIIETLPTFSGIGGDNLIAPLRRHVHFLNPHSYSGGERGMHPSIFI
jgi:hypothetical protein